MTQELFGLRGGGPLVVVALLVHVVAGVTSVAAGGTAALTRKGGPVHRGAGRVFGWSLAGVLATMAILVGARWEHNAHRVPLGLVAGAAATIGIADRRRGHRDSVHIVAMGTAYVALLTGFYVDNGPTLPLWENLPGWVFWVLPSCLGYPVVAWAIVRRRSSPTRAVAPETAVRR